MNRRSLRQSRRHSAQPYLTEIDDRVLHWSKQWVTPVLAETAAVQNPFQASSGGTPAPGAASTTNSPAVNGNVDGSRAGLGFSVKMWVVTDSSPPVINDGDDNDLLNMADYSVYKALPEQALPQQGGLSAADIRGAVGGEAIPGIESYSKNSHSANNKPEDNAEREVEMTDAAQADTKHEIHDTCSEPQSVDLQQDAQEEISMTETARVEVKPEAQSVPAKSEVEPEVSQVRSQVQSEVNPDAQPDSQGTEQVASKAEIVPGPAEEAT